MIIGGCDPYEANFAWAKNVDIFPLVTYPDIVNYLLFTPSAYSADDLKSYKSLEAYNQFVCGWVRDTAGTVQGDHLVVTAKVGLCFKILITIYIIPRCFSFNSIILLMSITISDKLFR